MKTFLISGGAVILLLFTIIHANKLSRLETSIGKVATQADNTSNKLDSSINEINIFAKWTVDRLKETRVVIVATNTGPTNAIGINLPTAITNK